MKTWAFSRTNRIVIAVVLGLAALVVLSKTYTIESAYRSTIARAERDTLNAAGILTEHAARTFDGVSRALNAVRALHADVESGAVVGATAIHGALNAIQGGSPVILAIGWSDAAGNRIASSIFRDPPPLNIADQDQFRVHRDDPTVGLYISAPVRSRVDGSWVIPVSRRIEDQSGRFAGIVNAVLRLNYFGEFYRAINLGADTVVVLSRRRDNVVIAREPMIEEWLGRSLAESVTYPEGRPRSRRGNWHGPGPIDGKDRIFGYEAIPGFPLVVATTMSRDDALASFREVLASSVVEGLLMIVALAIGGALLVIAVRRRAAASRELAETGALLHSVFATTNQAICVFDRDLRAVAWNDLCVTFFGPALQMGRDRTLETMLRTLAVSGEYGAGDIDAFIAERLEAARASRPVRYERVRPNGMVVDVNWLPLPNGFLALSHTDITHQKQTEIALRESEARAAQAHARLSDAIESLPNPFLVWDAEERLVLFNSAAAGPLSLSVPPDQEALTLGIQLEDAVSRFTRSGRVPAAVGREDDHIRERLEQIRRGTGERIEVQHAEGRWFAMRNRRTRDGGIVSLLVDITESKAREVDLSAARKAADTANRAKSDFLSRMSHELRTPLNAVIGFAQMLQLDRTNTLTQRQQEYCRDIETGGRHLLALVNDVLDLARIESGKDRMSIESVPVADAFVSLRAAMTALAMTADVDLRVADPVGIPDVRADDVRLHQILLNLASNAIKYNRRGGAVDVAAVAIPGDRVRFVVTDTGIGIPLALQPELFEPFHRLGQEHSGIDGTGIGLAICKRLAEAMIGSIGFTSVPGEGSTFWVELPCDAAPALVPAATDAGAAAGESRAYAGGFSMLYVEDNPANMRLMEHLISILPHVVLLTASTPRLGLDLARAHRPDIIILDLHLPQMNGYEMLAHLNAMPEARDIPVMALSAAAMPSDIRRGLAAGFFRYLTKPIDVKELLTAIGECIPLTGDDDDQRRSAD